MAVVSPTPIDPLSTPPSTSDPVNFDVRADAFLGDLPDFQSQANALATNVFNNATDAAANATAAAADRVQTGLDRTQTQADRAQTDLDRIQTQSDRTQTGLDRVQTGQDKTATAADRVQTGLDKTATQGYRDEAFIYGTQQLNATSTTSHSLTAGSKTFTVQTNKGFIAGQYLSVARTSAPATLMQGLVTSYNKTTGELILTIDYVSGAGGPFTDWSIGLIGRMGASGSRPTFIISANTAAVAGNDYVFEAVCTLAMPPTPNANDTIGLCNGSGVAGPMIDFGTVPVKRRVVGVLTMTNSTDATVAKYTGNSTIGWGEV